MTTETESSTERVGRRSIEAERMRLIARRRFLKGTSLAMPAVMTLTPGTARALVSATCGDKALDADLHASHLLIDESDGQMRFSVQLYDRLVETTDSEGNVVLVPDFTPAYFQGLEDGETVWRSVESGVNLGPDQPADCNPDPNVSPAYGSALVHISTVDGSVVACGSPTNPANAVITSAAGSCMHSLAMRAGN